MKKSNLIKIVLGITLSLLVFGGCNQKKDVVDFKLFGDKMATLYNAHDATGLANLYTIPLFNKSLIALLVELRTWFIPTCVGNTSCRSFAKSDFVVHPHVRGEYRWFGLRGQ